MIRIAICDDEQNSRIYLKKLIQEQNVVCEITEYKSGEEFLSTNKAFDVDAFHYLVKPVSKEKFIEVFQKAVKQITKEMEQQKRTIRVQFANTNKVILIEDILYVESQNHKVILHTKQETIEYYAKISDLEEVLKEQFFRIHKGYLVNLACIDKYTKSEVVIISKTVLPLSKYKYGDFVKAYLHFIEAME